MHDVSARVLGCVEGVLGMPAGGLSLQMEREDVPAWDSLRHMQVVLALEDEFDIAFSDEEVMSGWPSVGACVESVQARVGSGA